MQYMESEELYFGNRNLNISDQLKEKLGIKIKTDTGSYDNFFLLKKKLLILKYINKIIYFNKLNYYLIDQHYFLNA